MTEREVADVLSQISKLSYRERCTLMLRFGIEDGTLRSLEEIARTFNISSGRARQIEIQSLRKIAQLADRGPI